MVDEYTDKEVLSQEAKTKLMAKLVDPITVMFRGESEIYWSTKIRELCPNKKMNEVLKEVLMEWAKKELAKNEAKKQDKS